MTVALSALVLLGAGACVETGSSVVARGEDGRVVAREGLAGSGRFEVEYVHSYYREPVVEHFVAEDEELVLVEISSTSDAVLDYYAVPGRKSANGRWLSLRLDTEQRFEKLPLIGTSKGRKMLVVSGRRSPLFGDDGALHLTLKVERDTPLTGAREAVRRFYGS